MNSEALTIQRFRTKQNAVVTNALFKIAQRELASQHEINRFHDE